MQNTLRLMIALSLSLSLVACGDDDSTTPDTDAGPTPEVDAGMTSDEDAGMTEEEDAGMTEEEDAGPMEEVDAGPPVDAGPAEECPDLAPTQGGDDLVISAVDLAGARIEFFNPTDSPIELDGYWLCNRPAYPQIEGTGITIPPGGYAVIDNDDLSATLSFDGDNDDIQLYIKSETRPGFGNRNNMVDFICWGDGSSVGRLTEAQMGAGGGSEVLWMGDDCAASPTSGAIVRNEGTAGIQPSDYDSTATFEPLVCE